MEDVYHFSSKCSVDKLKQACKEQCMKYMKYVIFNADSCKIYFTGMLPNVHKLKLKTSE